MDPSLLPASNGIVVENTSSKSSLIGANIKLLQKLNKKKNKIKRLKKSIKHKDQQILSLRNYILEMKKENSIHNDDTADILLDSFENMKVDEETIKPYPTPEDVEKIEDF